MQAAQATSNPTQISLSDISGLTARLAQVLAKEIELMKAMRIKEIEPLQKEKQKLTGALQLAKEAVRANPDIRESFTEEELEEFREVTEMFSEILRENYRHLSMAREVNARVMEAVKDALLEEAQGMHYGHRGNNAVPPSEALALSLNEVI